MSKPPFRRFSDPRQAADAAFRSATTKPADPGERPKGLVLPPVRELVSLPIDRDVLEHFQAGGPGWQERINAALRSAGTEKSEPQGEGLDPEPPSTESDR